MGEEEGPSAGEKAVVLIGEPKEISSVARLDVDLSRHPSLREDRPLGAQQLAVVILGRLASSHSYTEMSSTTGAYWWTRTTTSLGAQLKLIGTSSMLVARASGATVLQRATSSMMGAAPSLSLLLQQLRLKARSPS